MKTPKQLTVSEAGRLGGLKAAENMTPEQRKKRAEHAVRVRIENQGSKDGPVKINMP